MTVLSAIARACPKLGLEVPLSVFSSTEREHVELAELANVVAEEIASAYDWQVLKKISTITGDATTEDWPLEADYDRQTLKATMWVASRTGAPLEHVLDFDRWLGIIVSTATVSSGQWIIYGNQIHIRPALALADTAKYPYITTAIVDPASGANKAAFTIDTDVFLLDESVLRKGIIWRWKEQKGLPYAEAMQDYEIGLAEAVGRDKGSKILTIGAQRWRGGIDADYAFPGTIVP